MYQRGGRGEGTKETFPNASPEKKERIANLLKGSASIYTSYMEGKKGEGGIVAFSLLRQAKREKEMAR